MIKYALKRLGLMLFTFSVIMFLSFVLIRMLDVPVPSDSDAAAAEAALREAMGYNKPIIEQFFIYIKGIVTDWDWGYSFVIQKLTPVTEVISTRLPPTIIINFYSVILSIPLGITFGIYAALKKNKWQDHAISTGVMIFISIPMYVFAFLMQYYLSFKWGWFPLGLSSLADANDSWFSPTMFRSMILPVIAISLGSIAGYTRMLRAELSEILTNDFMLLARTKGLSKAQATVRHAMKNTMVILFPMILGSIIGVLDGSLILENIFGIPGVGQLYLRSIEQFDYNVFIAVSMFYSFIGLLTGIVVDISYGVIDPRIRMGGRR